MARYIQISLAVVIFGAMIFGIVSLANEYDRHKDVVVSRVYEGREYFTTQEYEGFKEYLAENQEVEILQLDVLASENPLVSFRVQVPVDVNCPYGEVVSTTYERRMRDFAFLIFFIVAAGGALEVFVLTVLTSAYA